MPLKLGKRPTERVEISSDVNHSRSAFGWGAVILQFLKSACNSAGPRPGKVRHVHFITLVRGQWMSWLFCEQM
jgi:hypothetical protein